MKSFHTADLLDGDDELEKVKSDVAEMLPEVPRSKVDAFVGVVAKRGGGDPVKSMRAVLSWGEKDVRGYFQEAMSGQQ